MAETQEHKVSGPKGAFEFMVKSCIITVLSIIEECYLFFLTAKMIDVLNNFEKIQKTFSKFGPNQEIFFNINSEDMKDIILTLDVSKNGVVVETPEGSFIHPFDIEGWIQDLQDDMQYLADSLIE